MKVHILPSNVISKIAAGEVIERPASVIKELIENALDAGTKSIELHVKQAGKTSICLKDTGCGIEQDDIETIFLRHSTSKIKKADDLFNIHSLGFRGEALYSIAAIADVTLRSKTKEAPATGWEIHMRGGEKLNLRPANMPSAGTEIEVKELFFNTPARRKFLKSNTTEIHQILNIFIPYTFLYPGCRFLLSHEDRTLLNLKPTDNPVERIAGTLNLDEKHILTGVHDMAPLKIQMFLGDINIRRSRRDMQFIFINNRPVQSKSISFHMNAVYRLIFPQGDHPFFSLFIQIPASNIDANIHPTKREVKIKDEQILIPILRRLCEKTLMTAGQAKEVSIGTGRDLSLQKTGILKATYDATALPSEIFTSKGLREPVPSGPYTTPRAQHFPRPEQMILYKQKDNLQDQLSRSRYIGPFINKFLLFEVGKSLLVVDQHAAQERITFEQFIDQIKDNRVEIQHLLTPYLVKVSPQDLLMWEEGKDKLESVGFSSTQFDKETVAVHTYPVLLKDPTRAVRDILSGSNVAYCDHETIARRACRASIMAGDALKPQQAEFLREQLIKCHDPFTCPHGRPTVITMSEGFLDKQFLRT